MLSASGGGFAGGRWRTAHFAEGFARVGETWAAGQQAKARPPRTSRLERRGGGGCRYGSWCKPRVEGEAMEDARRGGRRKGEEVARMRRQRGRRPKGGGRWLVASWEAPTGRRWPVTLEAWQTAERTGACGAAAGGGTLELRERVARGAREAPRLRLVAPTRNDCSTPPPVSPASYRDGGADLPPSSCSAPAIEHRCELAWSVSSVAPCARSAMPVSESISRFALCQDRLNRQPLGTSCSVAL